MTEPTGAETPAQEAERLLKEITAGPWTVAPYSHGDEVVNVVSDYTLVPGGASAHWIAELDAALDFDSDREAQLEAMYRNADFIAAAPRLLASLLETVKGLREERDRLQARAIVAEHHKALELMSRGSAAEQLEMRLREKLAEAEIRAEQAEAELSVLRAQQTEKKD